MVTASDWRSKGRAASQVRFPAVPPSDNDSGQVVKEYQELTPLSRIFACMSHTGVPYFQMGRPKKLVGNPSPNFQGL